MDRKQLLDDILNDNHIVHSPLVIDQLCTYYDLLIKKNEVMNLTAITEFEDVAIKHFADSLSVSSFIDLSDCSIIDIGTGAGFPGIPLKILYPDSRFVLLDSLNKRVSFLNEVIDALGLKNIEAVHGRAEELSRTPLYREQFDYSVSRAVANLASLCEFCIPFIKVGGSFISYKAAKVDEELSSLGKCPQLLGCNPIPKRFDFSLAGSENSRTLLFFNKVRATDTKYPRGGGKPLKNPLT